MRSIKQVLRSRRRGGTLAIAAATVSLAWLATPSASATARTSTHHLAVVAAENFWGAIASQVAAGRATVTSIITNPNADPHSYEPTAVDARTLAGADLVIENGVGYDPWASRLVAADQISATVLDVGKALHLTRDANPHRWYNPSDVATIVGTIVADLSKLDPGDASSFRSNAAGFENRTLAQYHALIDQIRSEYRGTKVGASESIFSMLAPALSLSLITPPSFLRAISEGTDVSAADKSTIDRQIATHQIAIYIYNTQNATPDILAQVVACQKADIPVATITETLAPARAGYASWQTAELRGILAALERAHRS